MLNRTPSNSSNVINSYRKRRMQKGPFLMYGAIALVVIGVILLIIWLASPGRFIGNMLATDTPTPTLTFTPTNTNTPTVSPTITETPTVTVTFTPSGPQPYIIQEGDSLESIAQRFNLGDDGSLIIYYANQTAMEANGGVIFVGQTITIPPPGSTLPTTTPIPADLPRGRLIEYRVLPGDTLAGIAAKFNSIA
jgi:LysM repeat protein